MMDTGTAYQKNRKKSGLYLSAKRKSRNKLLRRARSMRGSSSHGIIDRNNTDIMEIPEIITVETNSPHQTPPKSASRTPEKRNAEDDITTPTPSKKRRLEDEQIFTGSRLDSTFNDTENPIKISGRRIVNIDHFISSIRNLENHEPFSCNFGNMEVINEKRLGMMDELTFKCKMCHKVEKITTDVNNDSSLNLNTALVSAMTNTGQGFSQLQEICCCLDMPCMASKTYEKHQQIVNKAIHECTWESMEDAAKEEATIAIQEGRVDENGVPEITVIVDGAWCKRSYRTNYNAASGVACIMGYKTKKVLFIGIRNTYCCICARSDSKKETPPDHLCYKNWEKSPNSMEADIIVEGFRKSLKMYNLKYVEVIGDGDSSVMRRLAESLPYGALTTIRKVECTNHLLRNYIKKLREVGDQRRNSTGPVPRDLRNKVTNNLLRLRHAVTGAVKHYRENCSDNEIFETVKCLQEDIRNGPYHVFGVHSKCKDYFCNKTTASDGTKNQSSLVEDLKSYGVWQELMAANNYLACFTYSLYRNVTSNCVESYNAKICKYVGGKRVNFSQRNGYNVRSELSALSFNENEELNRRLHKKITLGKSPGVNSKTLSQSKQRKRQRKRRVLFSDKKNKRCKVFFADEDYGDVECPALDIEPEDMERRKVDFLQSLSKDEAGRQTLEQQSRGQSHCELWKFERRRRVTASNFGKICKMRHTTSGQKLVETLLYNEFKGSAATKYGIENEKTAIDQVQDLLGLQIEESGLHLDKNYPFLAASPDGTIDDKGLVEIKCPASARHLTPIDAVKQKLLKYCYLNKEGGISLKRNHNYFYQVQGQLHITGRKFCLFVIWTPHDVSIEKINRDDQFWEKKMFQPLKSFYNECVLPELIDPRIPRGLPVRERAAFTNQATVLK